MVDYAETKTVTWYAYMIKLIEPSDNNALDDIEWNMGTTVEQSIFPYLSISPSFSSWSVTKTLKL